MNQITESMIKQFLNKLFRWWKANKKSYPWRDTDEPYLILVSEFMLQQTQTKRVIPKYNEFIRQFPNLLSLSEANNKEVLHLWLGLGYNRRALWLKEAAKKIVELGFFPKSPRELKKIKGIGEYTSR